MRTFSAGFLKAIKSRTDLTIKSVWDHDAARGQQFADNAGARLIPDAKSIFDDPQINAVVITPETDRHHDLVLSAAAAKKDMFVEKPLGFAAADDMRWLMRSTRRA